MCIRDRYKTEVSQTLNIQRNGQKLFKFDIRPLSFDEITDCRKRATTYMPNPGGASLPLIEKSVSNADYMAWQIYIATVPESDGTKFWDNPASVSYTHLDVYKRQIFVC